MADTDLARLEQELLRVPGVRSARVVGGDAPSEIHIVTTSKRSPKQVVRDVQSLAAAGFGIPIDHRIVSVVQLDEPPPAEPAPPPAPPEGPRADVATAQANGDETDAPKVSVVADTRGDVILESRNGHRLVLDRVVFASKGHTGWVKVGLRWPDGRITEGAGRTGAERDTRARGAATALLQALAPGLESLGARVDIDHLVIQRVGSSDSVLVRTLFYERGSATPLVGSALVEDDVATAAVRAVLQAINRKLRLAAQTV